MKTRLSCIIFITIFITSLVCISGCITSNRVEETINESIAGGTEYITLDGAVEIKVIGSSFTKEEIVQKIHEDQDFLKETFPVSNLYVSSKGYYHVRTDYLQIDLDYTVLPIIQDDYVVAHMTLTRNESGNIDRSISMGEQKNSIRNNLLKTEDKFLLLYSQHSEYAVADDNTVYTIYGKEPDQIDNANTLFDAYATEYNTVLSNDFFNPDNWIKIN